MTLLEIFNKHNIVLKDQDDYRHPVDILEDMYLKLSIDEYRDIMKEISDTESIEGFIFDEARNRVYK